MVNRTLYFEDRYSATTCPRQSGNDAQFEKDLQQMCGKSPACYIQSKIKTKFRAAVTKTSGGCGLAGASGDNFAPQGTCNTMRVIMATRASPQDVS